jgi:predicted phosphoribosyltransferase
MPFRDRVDAGKRLAAYLLATGHHPDLVLGLPRGGVPVAAEVARALHAHLDVLVVRKIGVPGHEELAAGALTGEAPPVWNEDVLGFYRIGAVAQRRLAATERAVVRSRERRFRRGHSPVDVRGRDVVVVDDGVATGATLRAALDALRAQGPRRLIAAVPTGARDRVEALRQAGHEVVCLEMPEPFLAVGSSYHDFSQTSDDEVEHLLGGRNMMKVDECMKSEVVCCSPDDAVRDCAARMRRYEVGFLPVVDEQQKVIGTITDRDLAIRILAEGLPDTTRVRECMSTGVVSCSSSTSIEDAGKIMAKSQKSRLMVLDPVGRCVGVLSLSDLGQREDPYRAAEVFNAVTAREAH